MKTFIHHDGALGDVLLSLPCIRAIKAGSPFVHLAGRPDVASLLTDTGCVHEASSSESARYAPLYGNGPDEKMKNFLAGFGRAFVFTSQGNASLAGAVQKIIPRTTSVLTVPPGGVRKHAGEFRLEQIEGYGASLRATPMLPIPPLHRENARRLLAQAGHDGTGRPLIAVHPGSGGKTKCWPAENYFGLIERMVSGLDPYVVIMSGPAEEPALKEKIDNFARGRSGVAHVRDADLATVAGLLSRCNFFIGNDSGISHLAAAVGTAVIVLFGPTDPALWGPVGPRVRVIEAGPPGSPVAEITIDEVYRAAHEMQDRFTRPFPAQR